MGNDDSTRFLALLNSEIGLDVDGLLAALEQVPREIYALRQQIAPLKAELAMLRARYDSKGRSPSHFDISRGLLLSELMEEARVLYGRDPDFKEDAKGKKTAILLTDGRAENKAHAHPRYRKFLEEAQNDWKRIAELGREIGPLFDKIEGWQGRKEFLLQKLKQAEARTFAWAAEARLTPR